MDRVAQDAVAWQRLGRFAIHYVGGAAEDLIDVELEPGVLEGSIPAAACTRTLAGISARFRDTSTTVVQPGRMYLWRPRRIGRASAVRGL